MDIVNERIIELKNILTIKLSLISPYSSLTESERFPFRAMQAEIQALEYLSTGGDLDTFLSFCVENEYYAAAEGGKKVKEWIKEKAQ
jgi:hypothetical protein